MPPNLVPSSVLIFERLCLEIMECRRFSLKVTKVEEIATIVSLLFQASPTPTLTRRRRRRDVSLTFYFGAPVTNVIITSRLILPVGMIS